jgi:hypothetical protein
MIVDGLFHSTSDKIAWIAAGGGAAAPVIADYLHGINSAAVWLGPPLAAIFVTSKTILVWIQISNERRAKTDKIDEDSHQLENDDGQGRVR